jgi:Undecaprenyl-phosphate glucose phosphotransferase
MIRQRVNVLEWLLTIGHFFVPIVAFALAAYVRFESEVFQELYPRFWLHRSYYISVDPYSYMVLAIVVTLAWAVVVEHYELNRIRTLLVLRTGIFSTAKATATTMVVVLVATFFYRGTEFSRVFVISAALLMFVITLVLLQVFSWLATHSRARRVGQLRLVVVGSDSNAVRVAEKLKADRLIDFDVVAFIALPGQQPVPEARPVWEWCELETSVDLLRCDEALLIIPPERFGELQEFLASVRCLSVPARVVLDLGEGLFLPDRIFDFQGITLLDVRPYAVDTIGYVVGKRVFDIAFSLTALLLVGPFMALMALAIKLTSAGPVFFAQERIGLSGRRFMMLKFRTMVTQTSKDSSTQHTARQDPRITPVGKLLRRTSLDELPQFFNVLTGDMSVVGPRPELTFFVQKFRQEIPSYMARHNLKCGITGWAQVNGFRGSDSSIPQRIQYDLDYMRNWSLWLDLKIIALTVFRGLLSRNAF